MSTRRSRQCHSRPRYGCRTKAKSGHPRYAHGNGGHRASGVETICAINPAFNLNFNRDRFVLSNGHGSMLLYSLLHLTGYDVSIEDLKSFRQLHAKTAGHLSTAIARALKPLPALLGQGIAMR